MKWKYQKKKSYEYQMNVILSYNQKKICVCHRFWKCLRYWGRYV